MSLVTSRCVGCKATINQLFLFNTIPIKFVSYLFGEKKWKNKYYKAIEKYLEEMLW